MDIQQLRHLFYFATVAKEGSFARAADRLGISQPPLSQQIIGLEERFGARLLDRSRSGVTPTAAGRALLPQIEAVLREANRLEVLVSDLKDGKVSRLAVGSIGSAVQNDLPALIDQARTAFPDLAFDLTEMDSADLVTALRTSVIDIAFLRADNLGPNLDIAPLRSAPLCLALPIDHALASAEVFGWADVADLPLVQCRRDVSPAFFDAINQACTAEGLVPRVEKEVGSISSQIAMVACGMGFAVVPEGTTSDFPDTLCLRPLTPVHKVTTLAIGMRTQDHGGTIETIRNLWQSALPS